MLDQKQDRNRLSIATICAAMAMTALPTQLAAAKTKHSNSTNKTKHKRASQHHRKSGRGFHAGDETSPAFRYGNLSQDDCEAELVTRDIAFERVQARGVAAPVRLQSALRGVEFRSNLSKVDSELSPYDIADCRLVLALDDFAKILQQHNVIAVEHYSMYRPPSKTWPDDKVGIQHIGALSIDAAHFVRHEAKTLSVLDDFHGAIGAKTCGPRASPRKKTEAAVELRAILCEAVAARLFNVILTPNHNRPHRNHFHMEVMKATSWFLVD
jgi:hypothetical protein